MEVERTDFMQEVEAANELPVVTVPADQPLAPPDTVICDGVLKFCLEGGAYDVMTAPVGRRGEKGEEYRSAVDFWNSRLCFNGDVRELKAYSYALGFGRVNTFDRNADWCLWKFTSHRMVRNAAAVITTVGPYSNGYQKQFTGSIWEIVLGEVVRKHQNRRHCAVQSNQQTAEQKGTKRDRDADAAPQHPRGNPSTARQKVVEEETKRAELLSVQNEAQVLRDQLKAEKDKTTRYEAQLRDRPVLYSPAVLADTSAPRRQSGLLPLRPVAHATSQGGALNNPLTNSGDSPQGNWQTMNASRGLAQEMMSQHSSAFLQGQRGPVFPMGFYADAITSNFSSRARERELRLQNIELQEADLHRSLMSGANCFNFNF